VIIQVDADDGIGAAFLGLLFHIVDGHLLGTAQRCLISGGTPPHHVAHSGEEVAKHVGADDGIAADDALVFLDAVAFDLVCRDDQHRLFPLIPIGARF
jgi:hypothetical protein